VRSTPATVVRVPGWRSAAISLPGTTWYVSTVFNRSGLSSTACSTGSGSFANASSVGAKTVNGPSLFKVATRSASMTRAASSVNTPFNSAVPTMSAGPSATVVAAATVVDASAPAVTTGVPSLESDPHAVAASPRHTMTAAERSP